MSGFKFKLPKFPITLEELLVAIDDQVEKFNPAKQSTAPRVEPKEPMKIEGQKVEVSPPLEAVVASTSKPVTQPPQLRLFESHVKQFLNQAACIRKLTQRLAAVGDRVLGAEPQKPESEVNKIPPAQSMLESFNAAQASFDDAAEYLETQVRRLEQL